jgi:ribokinase
MILVAGSANLDFVVRAARVPAPGETVLGRGFRTFAGGKGANQAIACARTGGAATGMLLALGADAYAAPIEESLRAAGVHLHLVRVRDQATGTAFVCIADDAENAITVAPGANQSLRAEHLPSLADTSHLLLQLESPIETVTAFARVAHDAGLKVALNAAPARPLDAALLERIDILIVNEGELATIAGHRGSVADDLAAIDVPLVVATLGVRGCCARSRGEFVLQPGFAVEAIDTTAAGDTFCGALVAALSLGSSLSAALRRANAAAALACTRLGAQASIPTSDEVDAFLAANVDAGHDGDELADHCGVAR